MKQFLAFMSISLCLLTLSACETYEGLKDDISSIDLSSFTPAVRANPEDKHSNFLIDGDCPRIEVVDELSMLSEYVNPQSPAQNEKISNVAISSAESTCTYGNRSVTVDLKLNFNGELGPQGKITPGDKPFFSYPYFVAVTDTSDKILAKEIFAAPMTYETGQNTKTYIETLRQIIPAENRAQGSRYKIMIGFQLTKAQLAENRQILEQIRLAEEARQAELAKQAAAAAKANPAASPADAISSAPLTSSETLNPPITIQRGASTSPQRAGPLDIVNP